MNEALSVPYLPVSEVAEIISGGTPKTTIEEYWNGDIPWLSVADFNTDYRWVESAEKYITLEGLKNSSSRLLNKGDIIISARGTVGALAQVLRPMAFNQSCYGLRGKDGTADINYLYYAIKNVVSELKSKSHGAVFSTIIRDTFSLISIPIYSIKEQRRIAHILGTLDDKIENNRKTAKTLEAMAQAIFKSWFVDFDPVRAKMTGELPESICKRLKLTPEILDLFPDRLVDSELGEIPEGWGNVPFSECVTIIGGGTPKTSVLEYWDGNIPWFSIVDAPIGDGIWVVDTEKKISESGLNNSSTRILPIGTTIITARGTVGRVAIVGVPMAMNQSCYGLRGKYDELGLFTHFSTRLIIKELLQRAHGSVFDTITRDTLESIEVTLPPTGIIDWFERMISLPMERLKQYSEETHIVTMLRDTLLPKLISGEIRVPDVDSIVGDSIRELHRDDLSKGTA